MREPTSLPDLRTRLALRPAEAARALGVSERTLRTMLPRLPHVREGAVILIPVGALRDWLRDQARTQADRLDAVAGEIVRQVRGL